MASDWDGTAETFTTERLVLTPLTVEDAGAMAGVLDDQRLHEFTGGRPLAAEELRARYAALVAGSGDPAELWLNWIVRSGEDRRPVGTVQATVVSGPDGRFALLAWVIGTPWQGHGLATEAGRGLARWLRGRGVDDLRACIHPDHAASAAVARRAGLRPTDELVDGELVWRSAPGLRASPAGAAPAGVPGDPAPGT